jgi:hypothetical protein
MKYSKKDSNKNFMKIRPAETVLLPTDSRMDRWTEKHNEDSFRFSKFCERA